jgi:hypothetical protein
MSNHSPYNNELANKMENVPMPNIEMAWADMEKRLAKKDDKKPIPFWLNGCAIFALVGILLLGGLYWYYNSTNNNYNKNDNDKKEVANILKDSTNKLNTNNNNAIENETNDNKINTKNSDAVAKNNIENNVSTINKIATTPSNDENSEKIKRQYKTKSSTKINITGGAAEVENDAIKTKEIITERKKGNANENFAKKLPISRKTKSKTRTNTTSPDVESGAEEENKSIETKTEIKEQTETTKSEPLNILKEATKEEKIASTEVKKELPKIQDSSNTKIVKPKKIKSKLIFSTGIGLQQQLPIDGQTNIPYNSLGRKGTLLDYIPSVYARIEKEKKWFIQIEGKYGAPQYNKELVYAQTSIRDTGFLRNFVNITSTTLKKSFYHQIPISFNYYVTPKWSVGAGMQFNKFSAALAETEEVRRNDLSQTEVKLSNAQNIVNVDSNNVFTKQYSLALLETQFQWRRFTVGAKYTFGLSPYINFTLPGGTQQSLTSKTALVFVKYELWRSKKRGGKK